MEKRYPEADECSAACSFLLHRKSTAQATGPFETCLGARRAAKDVLLDGGGGDEKWRSAKTDEQKRMEAEGRRGWEVVKELLHDHNV